MNSYSEAENARGYSEFMDSEEGKTQQKLIWEAIFPRVKGDKILDAACGTGWFAGKLAAKKNGQEKFNVSACDASASLVERARAAYPNVHFDVADLSQKNMPYAAESFSTVVLNMALHDFADMPNVLKNLRALLQPNGALLVTVANPYYSFPVGTWKRGLIGRILNRRPTLKLGDYGALARNPDRAFKWHSGNTSYFYTLPEMIKAGIAAGFTLTNVSDVMANSDSGTFGRHYKMYRYPLIVLLEFN
jgi:ubiquinone/menaquinone biosynthesis C-methylase UbiE